MKAGSRVLRVLSVLVVGSLFLMGCPGEEEEANHDPNHASNHGTDADVGGGEGEEDVWGEENADEVVCEYDDLRMTFEEDFSGWEISLEGTVGGIDTSTFSHASYRIGALGVQTLVVFLADAYGCMEVEEPSRYITLIMPGLGEGTHNVNSGAGFSSTQNTVNVSLAIYGEVDGEVEIDQTVRATGGTVTFTRFDYPESPQWAEYAGFDGMIEGTVELDFPDGERVTGTFKAPHCLECP